MIGIANEKAATFHSVGKFVLKLNKNPDDAGVVALLNYRRLGKRQLLLIRFVALEGDELALDLEQGNIKKVLSKLSPANEKNANRDIEKLIGIVNDAETLRRTLPQN